MRSKDEDEDEDEVRDEVEGEFMFLGVFRDAMFPLICGEVVSPWRRTEDN